MVHLLASLPESYNVLVTALEAPLEDGRKALTAGQNKGFRKHLRVITVTSLAILRKIAESI